jgi:hypothetical protein
MNGAPIKQHELSKTYLKRFVSDPNSRNKKSYVECLRIFPKKFIEKKSIKSDFFTTEDFYSAQGDNPFIIEEFFANSIEPFFNDIMREVFSEKSLSQHAKEKLVLWLWFSKFRNSHFRTSLDQVTNFMLTSRAKYTSRSIKEFIELKEGIDDYSKQVSKKQQIESLLNNEHIENFMGALQTRHWLILKSNDNNSFITNDNPGFSVNVDWGMGKVDVGSINLQFSLHYLATNYYPLSPKYCLMISPFRKGTSLSTDYWNLKIRYIATNNNLINENTYLLMRKFCISNKKEFLEKYLNIELPNYQNLPNLPYFPIGGVIVRHGEEDLTKLR